METRDGTTAEGDLAMARRMVKDIERICKGETDSVVGVWRDRSVGEVTGAATDHGLESTDEARVQDTIDGKATECPSHFDTT